MNTTIASVLLCLLMACMAFLVRPCAAQPTPGPPLPDSPKRQHPLVWYSLSASMVATSGDRTGNSPREAFAIALAPAAPSRSLRRSKAGWGLAYAKQRIHYRGDGPTLHGSGWLGSYSTEPRERIISESALLIKEFHGVSPYFRPCIEAGPAFIRFEYDVLETITGTWSHKTYRTHVRQTTGLDIGFRGSLAISRFIGLQAGLNLCLNSIRSYSSFTLGLTLGVVRTRIR